MNQLSTTKKRVLFLTLMVILGAAFIVGYMALNGNANQVYNDIVIEYTSIFSSNKSAERNLIYILCFAGIAIYTIYYLFTTQRRNESEEIGLLSNQKAKEYLCAILSTGIVLLLVQGGINQIVFAAAIFAMTLYAIDKGLMVTGISVYFLSVYSYIALYRVYVYRGGEEAGNNLTAILFSLIVMAVPLLMNNKKKALLRLGLMESVMIPFALLIFLSNKYKNGDEIVTIEVSSAMKITVWGLIAVFVGVSLIYAIKKWKNIDSIEEVIRIGSCITIMGFNRFDGTGAIMSTDLHHPFENIIGYSQVTELGRIPFKDYIPISGMYSIVQGAIFDWFGDGGTFANYNATNNFFFLLAIICIVLLLKKHVDGSYMLLVSLIFYVQSYNRLVFILPIMLLLLVPGLIDKKNTWLMAWFMTSLFQGLYYPLYGVATSLAFMPMVIWQIVTYFKSGELKKDIKTIKFWLGWIICFGIAIACIGFLLGTLKHMLAMSSQSILADGISRFGQILPGGFFDYLGDKHPFIRLSLYYIVTFIVPSLVVWVSYSITTKIGQVTLNSKSIQITDKKKFFLALSIVIMPVVCYSFTVIRLDIGSLYARSASVLFTVIVIMIVLAVNYIENGKLRLIIVSFAVAVPAVVGTSGFLATDWNNKLQAYYTVPENYIYVENNPVEKIGTGFINQDTYTAISDMNNRFASKDKEQSYCGDPNQFGYYYLLGVKGDGAMEIAATVKGYSAASESVDIARENHSIVGANFYPAYNYYFYHWLLASGEYYWDAEQWAFIPNDGVYLKEEILEQNKNNGIVSWNVDLGKTPSSWGLSMDSLEQLFTEKPIGYSLQQDGTNEVRVNFDEAFDGDEADFIYLEFANMDEIWNYTLFDLYGEVEQTEQKFAKYLMKKNYNPGMTVQIWWQDENGESHAEICKMSQGKLLIPIGAGAKWLFNNHDHVEVHVFQDDLEIAAPAISNIRFLKIREVQ